MGKDFDKDFPDNEEDPSSLFLEAVKGARPITPSNRVLHSPKKPKPVPHHLMRDERQALAGAHPPRLTSRRRERSQYDD